MFEFQIFYFLFSPINFQIVSFSNYRIPIPCLRLAGVRKLVFLWRSFLRGRVCRFNIRFYKYFAPKGAFCFFALSPHRPVSLSPHRLVVFSFSHSLPAAGRRPKVGFSFEDHYRADGFVVSISDSNWVGSGSHRCPPTPPGILTYHGGFY